MKQLLPLFLFLLPCLALAQYPTNGNQKITLGEQTSADGLVYRGVLADTGIITPSSDTSAYIILDTVNHRFYNYNRATNVWSVTTIGSISSGLTGTLPVANGGTGQNTLTANKVLVGNGTTGILSPNNLTYSNEVLNLGTNVNAELRLPERGQSIRMENSSLSITLGGAGLFISNNSIASKSLNNTLVKNTAEASSFIGMRYDRGIHFSTNIPGTVNTTFPDDTLNRMMIALNGNVGIGTTFFGSPPTEKLHVVGNGRFTAVGAGTFSNNLNITSTGVLTTATSDEKFKYNIRPLNYGLKTLLQLKPVNFQWIEGEEEDLGFIAQDVADIIPEAVNTNWSSDLLFRYESLIPVLTKAIQEQQALIKALEQRIINLENK